MAKYMVLYNSLVPAREQMAGATAEQMAASMDEWMKWRDEASQAFKVDFGMPLQAISRVTINEVNDISSQVSGYAIVEGVSEDAVVDLILTHPHLKRPGTSIDVLEMVPMPGM